VRFRSSARAATLVQAHGHPHPGGSPTTQARRTESSGRGSADPAPSVEIPRGRRPRGTDGPLPSASAPTRRTARTVTRCGPFTTQEPAGRGKSGRPCISRAVPRAHHPHAPDPTTHTQPSDPAARTTGPNLPEAGAADRRRLVVSAQIGVEPCGHPRPPRDATYHRHRRPNPRQPRHQPARTTHLAPHLAALSSVAMAPPWRPPPPCEARHQIPLPDPA
jgi:hypothetical protein